MWFIWQIRQFKLFFMCDKSLKGVQELQQILRTASKDGIDKEVMDAKLEHMDGKLSDLKQEIIKTNEKHKKELKLKDKEIRKGKETQRMLEQKLEQSKAKNKNGDPAKHGEHHHYASGDKSDSSPLSGKYALEREVRKKREAQQKVRDCKKEIQELQQKLAERERENQKLRQDLEIHQLLLEQFTNQRSQNSQAQDKNEDFDEEEQNGVSFTKKGAQMMDLSEGRDYERLSQQEHEPRKLSQDKQTDDQQSESDEYFEKMITRASQEEHIIAPSLKQVQSMETEASSQVARSQEIEPSPVETKQKVSQTQPQAKNGSSAAQEKGQSGNESPNVKSKSWSIWQYWFKKSK